MRTCAISGGRSAASTALPSGDGLNILRADSYLDNHIAAFAQWLIRERGFEIALVDEFQPLYIDALAPRPDHNL